MADPAERIAAWARLETMFMASVIRFAGISYSLVLGILLLPAPPWLIGLCGVVAWTGWALAVEARILAEEARGFADMWRTEGWGV